jgi:DNA mismatch repair protein MutS2
MEGNTIDVRGKRATIALMHIEQELSEKMAYGTVFIVHGVGTGALRREVHALLKRDPMVARFHLEENSNGGCTVVHSR